ncbi:methionine aminopeptidase 2b [Phtheirospermum japonicum]|uniref:Methionine aminopeptidase 2b n=1 Tax=Phtheirospermum japonicum TaxID=374723 RepID=A0A830BZI7_9LAMI|nr:methionine aminopeptidase 2b [Phtheirospermum japonicum]
MLDRELATRLIYSIPVQRAYITNRKDLFQFFVGYTLKCDGEVFDSSACLMCLYFDELSVPQLMMINCKRAIPLFIQHRDIISLSDVVSQLTAKNKCDYWKSLRIKKKKKPFQQTDPPSIHVVELFCIWRVPKGVAAHWNPSTGDKTVLQYDDVMKLDFGTLIDVRLPKLDPQGLDLLSAPARRSRRCLGALGAEFPRRFFCPIFKNRGRFEGAQRLGGRLARFLEQCQSVTVVDLISCLDFVYDLSISFLQKMFYMNPQGRVTACDALKCPYYHGLQ